MTPPDVEGGWIGALMGAGGLAGALLYVRRQLSRDQTGMASDKAERSQISRLEGEIERLTAELKLAQAGAQRSAFLEAEASYLKLERDRLMRDIKRAVRGLSPDRRAFLETDFSALADVEERIEPKA